MLRLLEFLLVVASILIGQSTQLSTTPVVNTCPQAYYLTYNNVTYTANTTCTPTFVSYGQFNCYTASSAPGAVITGMVQGCVDVSQNLVVNGQTIAFNYPDSLCYNYNTTVGTLSSATNFAYSTAMSTCTSLNTVPNTCTMKYSIVYNNNVYSQNMGTCIPSSSLSPSMQCYTAFSTSGSVLTGLVTGCTNMPVVIALNNAPFSFNFPSFSCTDWNTTVIGSKTNASNFAYTNSQAFCSNPTPAISIVNSAVTTTCQQSYSIMYKNVTYSSYSTCTPIYNIPATPSLACYITTNVPGAVLTGVIQGCVDVPQNLVINGTTISFNMTDAICTSSSNATIGTPSSASSFAYNAQIAICETLNTIPNTCYQGYSVIDLNGNYFNYYTNYPNTPMCTPLSSVNTTNQCYTIYSPSGSSLTGFIQGCTSEPLSMTLNNNNYNFTLPSFDCTDWSMTVQGNLSSLTNFAFENAQTFCTCTCSSTTCGSTGNSNGSTSIQNINFSYLIKLSICIFISAVYSILV
jgi:hypothetical protein